MTDAPRPLTLLLTAGEASGDRLGAELMQALKAALPDRSLRGQQCIAKRTPRRFPPDTARFFRLQAWV